jgi:dolichol-phosphate mannosyltransferase
MNQLADCEPAVRNELTPDTPPSADRVGPVLSIIIPTFNERDNVRLMVDELCSVLTGINWEVIFVDDDSPDGTAELVRDLGRQHARIRCIQRIGRRGLSSACVEGMLGSSAPYVAVMDGDLQHDPAIIPKMLAILIDSDVDLVVGSRYVAGGGAPDFSRARQLISRFATRIGRAIVPESLKDPMSGFFMLRRALLDDVVRNLSALGFKILVDIVASARRPVVIREVPFEFRVRRAGTSKLDSLVAWEYLMLLADKLIGRYVPVRFIAFAAIGGFGLIAHIAVLTVAFRMEGVSFVTSQTLAAVVSMVFNYSLNNALTYRDQRRRGFAWFTGLVSFMAVCSVGAVANVGIASYFFNKRAEWLLAAVSGVIVGAVWNYAVTSVYTWGRPKSAKK